MLFDYFQSMGKSQKHHMNNALGKHFQIFIEHTPVLLKCQQTVPDGQEQRALIKELTVYMRKPPFLCLWKSPSLFKKELHGHLGGAEG